ncbi:28S ribosomal protein S2, mitochondrial-like [Mizuhopecten yessoensis]|uniref:28S ribosomal protein S2, mitochondrial-like n=1 Tax=Mizuhopecten yessoensis TaxID=6573 RepID=UPI000B45F737|nr:28S ribosomal protein S2, mitochondrial-like [Mizuhopecten yessoensis]
MAAVRGKVVTFAKNGLFRKLSSIHAASCPVHTLVRRRVIEFSSNSPITCQTRSIQYKTVEENRQNETLYLDNHERKLQNALTHDDYFQVKDLVKVEDLFETCAHLGHKTGVRNEYMSPYIYGNRIGVDILDLGQTVEHMQLALNFLAHIAYRGGVILFISRNVQSIPLVEKTAEEAGEYSHCRYWRGGIFTNATQQFGSVTRLPDTCIFLSTLNSVFEQHTAVVETAKMLIPTVGIVDTNTDPRLICYPVPGNDDSLQAIALYCRLFKQAILNGKEMRKKDGLE